MTMRVKMIVAGVVLAGALGYLALAGSRQGLVYTMAVDEFMGKSQLHGQRVRLNGKVLSEGLLVQPGVLKADFQLAGTTSRVPVSYTGVIPDMFKADHEVIVEGKLDEKGTLVADVLMTKCASKYEARPADHAQLAGDVN